MREILIGLILVSMMDVALAQDPVTQMYLDQLPLVEREVVSLTQAMPADMYDFAPVDGAFAGVRTFGEQVRHVATMTYMTAALVLEEPSPYGPGVHNNGPDDIRSKEEVVAYLEASLAYARRAIESLTEDTIWTWCRRSSARCPAQRWPRASPTTASTTTDRWWSTQG